MYFSLFLYVVVSIEYRIFSFYFGARFSTNDLFIAFFQDASLKALNSEKYLLKGISNIWNVTFCTFILYFCCFVGESLYSDCGVFLSGGGCISYPPCWSQRAFRLSWSLGRRYLGEHKSIPWTARIIYTFVVPQVTRGGGIE